MVLEAIAMLLPLLQFYPLLLQKAAVDAVSPPELSEVPAVSLPCVVGTPPALPVLSSRPISEHLAVSIRIVGWMGSGDSSYSALAVVLVEGAVDEMHRVHIARSDLYPPVGCAVVADWISGLSKDQNCLQH